MATVFGQRLSLSSKLEPVLSQGRIEKCFPAEQACTERDRFARLDAGRSPADEGIALIRGIATGAMAERELLQFAGEGRLTVVHVSSHQGDDYLRRFELTTTRTAQDGFELVLARRVHQGLRLYGGGYAHFHTDSSDPDSDTSGSDGDTSSSEPHSRGGRAKCDGRGERCRADREGV